MCRFALELATYADGKTVQVVNTISQIPNGPGQPGVLQELIGRLDVHREVFSGCAFGIIRQQSKTYLIVPDAVRLWRKELAVGIINEKQGRCVCGDLG